MKNAIDEIICAFSREEYREFKYFLNRNGSVVHDRSDLKFLEQIRSGAVEQLKHTNNFSQIRKRLKKHLELFAAIQNVKENQTSQAHNFIETARYLFHKTLYKQAWEYLYKAEQMAIQLEEYSLLDYIYNIQISYSSEIIANRPEANILELLNRREKNFLRAQVDGNANSAYALLLYEIGETFSKEMSPNTNTLVSTILKRYKLKDKIYENPNIYSKIVSIVCRSLREGRAYSELKQYALKSYAVMKEKEILEKTSPDFMMNLLREICLSSIRTKDYMTYENFINLYADHIEEFKIQNDKYLFYYFSTNTLKADLYMCTNRLDKAKEVLYSLYEKYKDTRKSVNIFYTLRVNLLAICFMYDDYKACIHFYTDLMQYNYAALLREARLSIILYTEIYALIIYYENNDIDYAYYLLKNIRRKYAAVLKGTRLKREKNFMKIMERIINDPSYLKSKLFQSEHDFFIKLKEYTPGDYEYISLNAWLTSKLTGKTYYECFIELVE